MKTKRLLYNVSILMLLIIGLALVFNKPIRNFVIKQNSNKYNISHVTRKDIKKNENKDVSFDFEQVNAISTEAVLKAQMDAQALPVIGGIAIPDLKMNLPIFKGVGNTPLMFGAGTMKESQVMGGENNYALASHHVFGMTGASDALFSPLTKAKVNQKIYLTDEKNVYTYVIKEVYNVDPTAVDVINDEPHKKLLTLVTCTDAAASQRIIVKAELTVTTNFKYASDDQLKAFSENYSQIKLQ